MKERKKIKQNQRNQATFAWRGWWRGQGLLGEQPGEAATAAALAGRRGGARRCPPGPRRPAKLPGEAAPLRSAARSVSQINAAARALRREGGGDRPAAHPRQEGGRCAALRSAVLIAATAGKRLGKGSGCARRNWLLESIVSVAERK